ncbi:MAG: Gmad2 immunoglobulin-like domain-containing protein [Nocardioidaceae bacterium]
MTDDDQIRALLDDAVSDVQPRHGLDTIQARTAAAPSPNHRPWLWGVGGAVVATAATVAAVAALGNGPSAPSADPGFAGTSAPATQRPSAQPSSDEASEQPSSQPGDRASASDERSDQSGDQLGDRSSASARPSNHATDDPSRTPSSDHTNGPSAQQVPVPVYYVADTNLGQRLFREFHAAAGKYALDQAVEDAVSGNAGDADYGTVWPSGSSVQRAQLSGGVLSVDLTGPVRDRPAGMSDTTAHLALQQVIYTAQGVVQARVPVTFLVDGTPTSTVLGVSTARPVPNAAADDVLAQVWVTSPGNGSTVSSPFTVEGVAAAFEANVQWELRQGDTVVKRGFTTAQQCCTMAPYRFQVTAPPGEYTLVVHDEDASGEHPQGLWQDTKQVIVR